MASSTLLAYVASIVSKRDSYSSSSISSCSKKSATSSGDSTSNILCRISSSLSSKYSLCSYVCIAKNSFLNSSMWFSINKLSNKVWSYTCSSSKMIESFSLDNGYTSINCSNYIALNIDSIALYSSFISIFCWLIGCTNDTCVHRNNWCPYVGCVPPYKSSPTIG